MPKVLKVSAKDPGMEKGKKVREPSSDTIEHQTGETAKESIEMFGDEPVLSNANANWVVTMLAAGKSQAEIQKEIGSSKMGVSRARTADPQAAIKKQWATWSPEQRAAFIKEMKETE